MNPSVFVCCLVAFSFADFAFGQAGINVALPIKFPSDDGNGSLPFVHPHSRLELNQTSAIGLDGGNMLNEQSIYDHLFAMIQISEFEVEFMDRPWTMLDLCWKGQFDTLEQGLNGSFLAIFNQINPCVVATPLDCFYEGSWIHGPNPSLMIPPVIAQLTGLPVELGWFNFLPNQLSTLLDSISEFIGEILPWIPDAKALIDWMGLENGYLDRPCLDVTQVDCPMYNKTGKVEKQPIDFNALSGGCDSIARKVAHWSEDQLMGGIEKDASGKLSKVSALKSVVYLATPEQIYRSFYYDFIDVENGTVWNLEAASSVLDLWKTTIHQVYFNATEVEGSTSRWSAKFLN